MLGLSILISSKNSTHTFVRDGEYKCTCRFRPHHFLDNHLYNQPLCSLPVAWPCSPFQGLLPFLLPKNVLIPIIFLRLNHLKSGCFALKVLRETLCAAAVLDTLNMKSCKRSALSNSNIHTHAHKHTHSLSHYSLP